MGHMKLMTWVAIFQVSLKLQGQFNSNFMRLHSSSNDPGHMTKMATHILKFLEAKDQGPELQYPDLKVKEDLN